MSNSNTFIQGVLLGIFGVVLFSSKAVMVKLAYRYQVDAITLLTLRMLFAFPFYLLIAYLYRNHKKNEVLKKSHWLWLLCFGILGYYLASLFDFLGLQYIKAGLERIILFLYPTIVLLINRVFLKTQITKIQIFAILLTYLGVVITFAAELDLSSNDLYRGAGLVFLSAITYASYISGSGWLIPKFGVMRFTAYAMMISCVCVFVHYLFVGQQALLMLEWQIYVLALSIAVIATVIPSFLVSMSIKLINSSNFSIVAGVGPISTILLAVVFLDERLTYMQLFGAIVVIIGIMLVKKNTARAESI